MAKYRQFHVGFWDDPDVELYDPTEKLIFAYLFTNRSCSESGIYPISIKKIAYDTSIPIADVKTKIESGIKNVFYDWDMNIVFVARFLMHNGGGRPDLLRVAIIKECRITRSNFLWEKFIEYYPNYADDLIPEIEQFVNGLQTVDKPFNSNSNRNSNSDSNRKGDKPKKEKKEKGTRPAPAIKTYIDKVNQYFDSDDPKICEPYWAAAYPNVDIKKELPKAKAWLISNTKKAKSDFRGFCNNWLKTEMEKISRRGGPIEETPQMIIERARETCEKLFKDKPDNIPDSSIFAHMDKTLGFSQEILCDLIDEFGGPEKLTGKFPMYYKIRGTK